MLELLQEIEHFQVRDGQNRTFCIEVFFASKSWTMEDFMVPSILNSSLTMKRSSHLSCASEVCSEQDSRNLIIFFVIHYYKNQSVKRHCKINYS